MFGRTVTLSRKTKRSGFTLIELAIVLAVTSLLAAGLWRMMATGNSQLRDQAAADQMKELISAVRGYLASTDGTAWVTSIGATAPLPLPAVAGACGAAPLDTFCNFLPTNFTNATANSYGQRYEIQVRREPAAGPLTGYSFMIKTTAGDVIPDTSGGRISSMIGNDGGFVYAASVCGPANTMACGAYGTWQADPAATYGHLGTAGGQIASRTFVGMNASMNSPWLARHNILNDAPINGGVGVEDFNVVQTDIALGGNTLFGGFGQVDEGGMLDNFTQINVGRPLVAGGMSALYVVGSGCNRVDPADATCPFVSLFTGGVSVTGLLQATRLYATQFIYESSDRRLKHDIQPIDKPLDKFSQMNGYSFLMNNGNEKKYGVVAQEVEAFFPELVIEDSQGYKTVDYMGLIGPLVAAVKELKVENDKLKVLIDKQGAEIQKLGKTKPADKK